MNKGPLMRSRAYLNGVLTIIAVMLGMLVVGRATGVSEAVAQTRAVAQPAGDDDSSSARISAAEQRKAMIAELKTMNQRLAAVEAALKAGINVKVKEMPKIEVEAPKSERRTEVGESR